jgi:transforming growth factor-beta-induced protein
MKTYPFKSFRKTTFIAGMMSVALLAGACDSDDSTDNAVSPKKTIVGTAQAAGTFKTLVAALTAGELVSTLEGAGPFTVFAPTDEAFAKLPAGTVENLLKPENKAALQKVLKYHVVSGKVLAADVVKLTSATTLEGSTVEIKVSGASVMVNSSKVTATDIMASNGVIHVVDAVLLPKTDPPASETKTIVGTAQAAGTFKTLVAALTAGELVSTLEGAGPFTVFAPTDEAFAKLPAGTVENLLKPENKAALQKVLKYHVVSGKVLAADVVKLTSAKTLEGSTVEIKVSGAIVMVNSSKVTATDIMASNGVIHVVDAVLLPKTDPPASETKTIVGTAQAAGTFKTLVAALTAGELVTTLEGAGPFTVFAPTDEAFAKLPAGTVENLLKPENKAALQKVLKYHVVSGKVLAADVVKLTSATTLEGSTVEIKVSGASVMVNSANVTATDIMASNGVIHVVDAVLLPK